VERVAPVSRPLADRVLALGLALSLIALGVQSVLHLVNLAFLDLDVDAFNAGFDSSAFAWPTVAATAAAAFASTLVALSTGGRSWIALALTLAFLSFDDQFGIHERASTLGNRLGAPESWHLGRLLWPVIFLPLLALATLLLWRLAATRPGRPGRIAQLGLGLLVAAVALEAASPLLFQAGWDQGDWPYELEVVVEEGAELVGWIWIASVLTAIACEKLAAEENPAP
jgi:hypothetical protein